MVFNVILILTGLLSIGLGIEETIGRAANFELLVVILLIVIIEVDIPPEGGIAIFVPSGAIGVPAFFIVFRTVVPVGVAWNIYEKFGTVVKYVPTGIQLLLTDFDQVAPANLIGVLNVTLILLKSLDNLVPNGPSQLRFDSFVPTSSA